MNATAEQNQSIDNKDDQVFQEKLFYTPLSLDLVSALAGDRELTDSEKATIDTVSKDRGANFFTDLLYTVTHQLFQPSLAEDLWNKILQHKYTMSAVLNRNIRIAVATLDYLSNLTAELHSVTLSDESYISELVRLSIHDGLTGLFNHSSCFQKIGMELKRYARYGTNVSLMMIDIDNFKEINDRFGHQMGDDVLATLGKIIREEAREPDSCCRYGGEEFVVIMPLTESSEAVILAERLRERIAHSSFDGRSITISIGVASCGENAATSQELVKKADTALYEAKKNGRNRVVVSA
jgi:diguanylate cyclase (GGDEF)-like protein